MDDGDDDEAPFRHKDDEEVTAELFCLFYHPRTYHAHFSYVGSLSSTSLQ